MPFANAGDDQIYYVQQGEQGVPIVFIHGAGGSHLIWWNQMSALEPFARPMAIDLPGHGKSSPPGRNTVAAYSDVILRLLDARQFDRAVVVGHSMGGAISQMLALSHPDRVAGLGLIGTGARLRVLPAILNGIISADEFDKTVQFIIENSYAPGFDPAMREHAEKEMRACPPEVTHGDYVACNSFDVTARIGEVHAPALVICGREDKMTPVKYSEFLVSHLPHAQLVLVDNAGHFVMLEKPAEVSGALVGWVANLSHENPM